MLSEKLLNPYGFDLCLSNQEFTPDESGELQSDFISLLTGKVRHYGPEDEDGIRRGARIVGELVGSVIHSGEACNKRRSLEDIADASGELLSALGAVTDHEGSIVQFINDGLIPSFIIHVASIIIERPHRGQGLGLCLLHKLASMFSDSVILLRAGSIVVDERGDRVITKPSNDRWELSSFSRSGEAAAKRLVAYYRCMGFKDVGPDDSHWMALSGVMRFPTIKKTLASYRRLKSGSERANGHP